MQVFNKAGFTQGFATRPSSTKQPYLLVSTGGLATGASASITVDIVSLTATKPVLGLKVLYGGLP